jgi:hypothetical protein
MVGYVRAKKDRCEEKGVATTEMSRKDKEQGKYVVM